MKGFPGGNKITVLLILASVICCHSSKAARPNIIIVVVDDLGWNDVSFHGSPQIPTPNIDDLAQKGIILNNYYVSPVCSPSRGALMTGLHPIHLGMQHDVIYACEPWGLPLDKVLLPQWLKKLGYATRAVGKWHLGFFHTEYTPTFRGFDSHYGYWPGRSDYFDHTLAMRTQWGYEFYNNLDIDLESFGNYSTDLFAQKAEKIINEHNISQPLFLYLAHQGVHSANSYAPLQAPEKYIKKFKYIKNYNRRLFAGMMTAVEESVGTVLKALKKKGMWENSILVFTTDNGGPAAGFNYNAASNWPLRGVKSTLWEGGVRGVGFISSPLLKNSRVSMQMMHVTDWLPTLYHAAGGNVTSLGKLDGMDMWDVLVKNRSSPRTEILHNIDPIYEIAAIRVGDYKLIMGTLYNGQWDGWYGPSGRHNSSYEKKNGSIRGKFGLKSVFKTAEVKCQPKPANASTNCKPAVKPCLFNIRQDPCEYNNLADKFPEKVKKLLQRLQEYNATAVPPRNKPADPRCDPKLYGYKWVPWMDEL